ncbi:metallophosphoesterase [Roseibium aggregatum]|jgi:Icc-related predicted phosphoesterase|uniref:Putative phosphoesterase n=1 Tax=Roseibium aggregatum TaxID=187304 RepID=A0A0M6YB94_9HYPH|nr:metallophosphoesterase [Roseibium aggregatum]CTQ47345.1 putative phosphoesterase [Roseibium aggregatum]
MDCLVLSDLHLSANQALEKSIVDPRMANLVAVRDDVDLVICAGDLCDQGDVVAGMQWLRHYSGRTAQIILVLGNHDYFGGSIPGVLKEAREAADVLGIHLLENDSVVIGDVKFVGGTLWSDFNLSGDPVDQTYAMHHAKFAMEDFKGAIDVTEFDGRMPKQFLPQDAVRIFEESVAYLDAELSRDFDGEVVVITHNAPHPDSIADHFRGDSLTPAFVSDLSDLIDRHRPTVWIHGHTHASVDYELEGGTRVVCNPRGFENDEFDWSKIISVCPKPKLFL